MPDSALAQRLIEFVQALRGHGLLLGPAETVDAAAALSVLGLAEREQLRHGLAATLVRREGHRTMFDALFDLYFPAAVGSRQAALDENPMGDDDSSPRGAGDDRGRGDRMRVDEVRDRLSEALARGDEAALRRLAAIAVQLFGRVSGPTGGQGAPSSPSGYSALRTLDRLQPQTLIAQVSARAAEAEGDSFEGRLGRDEIRRRVEAFRELVRGEAMRRAAEARDRDQVARYAAAAVDQVDFLSANRTQLAELRRTVQPMSRRLAGRLAARRRRANRGVIDVRRTFRRSLATGGVPLKPAYRRRHPGRPEIVLLCDVSGSVAGFANFTLMLVEALHDQFSRVRAFAFVDSVDEVTQLVADNDADPGTLARRILAETRVARFDGHSDYGNALRQFTAEHLDSVGPRTSLLILGDARTNGADPRVEELARIVARARHAYWLNPEPRRSWPTGDSEARAYQQVIEMYECRTADQLARVITQLLPV